MRRDERIELKQRRAEAERLFSKGEFGQAIASHFDIIRRYRGNDRVCEHAYVDLGHIHLILMELELSAGYYQLALGYSPMKPRLHHLLGFTYAVADQWVTAIREFRFAARHDPIRFKYAYALGWALYLSGRESEAVDSLRCSGYLRSSEADAADIAADLLFHPDKDGCRRYAGLADRVTPTSRNARLVKKFLDEYVRFAESVMPWPHVN